MRPTPGGSAHWNNEVEPLRVWVDTPDGWTVDRALQEWPAVADMLAAGNSVIVKAAEKAPASAKLMIDKVGEFFEESVFADAFALIGRFGCLHVSDGGTLGGGHFLGSLW